ncbi:hypothetical protein SSX86_017361 [Deinandra increscens subsp. villosa]|uniref:Uncharacterized protein n=1 Tax=Deinandra increscens subsp. villosa TaxID=3103831 RepID=A0AAP0CUY3_9ASTR
MKSLIHNPNLSINFSSRIKTSSTDASNRRFPQFSPPNHAQFRRRLAVKAVIDSAAIDQYFGLTESDARNPTVSTSFRSPRHRKPNQTVLEAQARVCTGPTQTKPLTEEQAFKVFDTILTIW